MPTTEMYSCLGLSFLGVCSYNPAQPSPIYFSIGNAIAALALTVAIQQFLKPIYLFRLKAYKLRIGYLVSLVFLGFACAVLAMLLPNLPISHKTFFEYPVVWELLGGFLISGAYFATALISLVPARIFKFNLISFVRAGAALLSSADDVDRVNFAEDLMRHPHNINRLIEFTKAFQRAEGYETMIEFERLKEKGLPLEFRGPPPVNANYRLKHRKELELASYAATFLRIISDPQFCSVLVRRCAWLTASMLMELSEEKIHSSQAESFVQEIAKQAIVNDESMMAKEVTYDGFGSVPLLSESLFSDWFICSQYKPLEKFNFGGSGQLSVGYVSRLRRASELMLKTALSGKDYWGSYYMNNVEQAYESLFHELSYRRYKSTPNDFLVDLHMSVENLYGETSEALDTLEIERKKILFISDDKKYRHDLISVIASIVYDSLESISNRFLGVEDEAWFHAIGIFEKVFPSIGTTHIGINPIQQQIALKLIAKLKHNMQGMYPSISRVLLSVIGPYERHPTPVGRTAFVILRDATYKEIQKISELRLREPDKIDDFLPPDVRYDQLQNSLIHHYRNGVTQTTQLNDLVIPEVDLLNEINWQLGQ